MHWRNSWCSSFLLVLPTVLMRRTGEGHEDRREAAAVSAVLITTFRLHPSAPEQKEPLAHSLGARCPSQDISACVELGL